MTELPYCRCGDHVKLTKLSKDDSVWEIACHGCDVDLIGSRDKIVRLWKAWADPSDARLTVALRFIADADRFQLDVGSDYFARFLQNYAHDALEAR